MHEIEEEKRIKENLRQATWNRWIAAVLIILAVYAVLTA